MGYKIKKMKRVAEEVFSPTDLSNVSVDVIECIMSVMRKDDVDNMSLVCKRFYDASRRRRIIKRWMWCIDSTYVYLELRAVPWFRFIIVVKLCSIQMMLLLNAHGLKITQIRFNNNFAESFDNKNMWPASLKVISIVDGEHWNYPIENRLPDGLKKLQISSKYFCQPLRGLPPNLKVLYIKSQVKIPSSFDNLPDSIEDLTLTPGRGKITRLPSSLGVLDLSDNGWVGSFDLKLLPPTVTELYVNEFAGPATIPDHIKVFSVENIIGDKNTQIVFNKSTIRLVYIGATQLKFTK